MNPVSLVELLSALGRNDKCRFASLVYTAKESGEKARYTILLGFSYVKSVEASLLDLEIRKEANEFSGVELLACNELIASFKATLDGTQTGYTKAHTYAPTAVHGLKVNTVDNSFQLFGLVQTRVVLEPGNHKIVKSSEKTIAKNKIRKSLPIGKFREFALDEGVISTAKINGETIEFDNDPIVVPVVQVRTPVYYDIKRDIDESFARPMLVV